MPASSLLHYITADNPVARDVVYFLLALFAVWFGILAGAILRDIRCWRQIARVRASEESLHRACASQAELPVEHSVESRLRACESFDRYLEEQRLPTRGVVAAHLRAIFDAGLHESRLDIGDLLRHTNAKLFRANTLLRALLSIFVILGLLGTLFGLADTLKALSNLLQHTARLNSDTLG